MKKIKDLLGIKAAGLIENGSIVGLGTGTTSESFIKALSKRCLGGLNIQAVASSKKSYFLAKKLNIKLIDLEKIKFIDIYIDGADFIDENKQMIKGMGAALLREKILAFNSKKTVFIADSSKYKKKLSFCLLPVEITTFASLFTKHKLASIGFESNFRKDEKSDLLITDNGNYILDVKLPEIDDLKKIDILIKSIPGVIETGAFIDLADIIMIGYPNEKINVF